MVISYQGVWFTIFSGVKIKHPFQLSNELADQTKTQKFTVIANYVYVSSSWSIELEGTLNPMGDLSQNTQI